MSPLNNIQSARMAKSMGTDRTRSMASVPGAGLLSEQALRGLPNALGGGLGGGYSSDLGPVALPADTYVFLLQDTIMRLRDAEAKIAEQKERIDHLETLSLTDELTGLLNRRGFVDAFRRELASASRKGTGGVLVIVDLDGFKGINDTHGHLCGDWYLRQVGRALKDNVRGHDIVARFGGDEFAILLTDTDAEQGQARAEALSQTFNAQVCRWQMTDLPLRASFGTEPYGGADKEEEVIRRADTAMYKVKRASKAAR